MASHSSGSGAGASNAPEMPDTFNGAFGQGACEQEGFEQEGFEQEDFEQEGSYQKDFQPGDIVQINKKLIEPVGSKMHKIPDTLNFETIGTVPYIHYVRFFIFVNTLAQNLYDTLGDMVGYVRSPRTTNDEPLQPTYIWITNPITPGSKDQLRGILFKIAMQEASNGDKQIVIEMANGNCTVEPTNNLSFAIAERKKSDTNDSDDVDLFMIFIKELIASTNESTLITKEQIEKMFTPHELESGVKHF